MKLSVYKNCQETISSKFVVSVFNSRVVNKLSEAFINFTLNFQLNDARQIPIKIPTTKQLKDFNEKFDQCFDIKKRQFAEEITEIEAKALLKPIEKEIDKMVEKLYGINE